MAIVREPKGIDFVVNSEPWSEKKLKEFRKLMKNHKNDLDDRKRSNIQDQFKKVAKHPA